jgi:hypothetical protein
MFNTASVNLKETFALTRNKEGLILIEWVARPEHNWDNLTPGRRFFRPWHTTHLHSVLKNAQLQHAPLLDFVPGSMLPLRVGDEEPHTGAPQDGLLFNLEMTPPLLKNTVFPPFLESEQGPTYGNVIEEEARDP